MRKAFSLVELLVVIALIGILIALLIPAIHAARHASIGAKEARGLQNLSGTLQEVRFFVVWGEPYAEFRMNDGRVLMLQMPPSDPKNGPIIFREGRPCVLTYTKSSRLVCYIYTPVLTAEKPYEVSP